MQDNVLANPWQSEKKYPVDISNTELPLLACRGSKGRSPLASLGAAQRLTPVQSGLPLCGTCLSSPHYKPILTKQHFPTALSTLNGDDGGFVVQELTVEKEKSSPFDRFSLSETGCSCITPMRSIGQSCAVTGTLFFSSSCLFNPPPSANAFLLYFPVISVFLFLDLFPFLLKDIKIAVINIHCFFCYSVSVKLFLTVSLFSCYCYFITI